MNIPAQYAKFITALVAALVLYLQRYGATWQLVPAFSALAGALAVMGVPNAPKPAQFPPVVPPRPNPAPLPPPLQGGIR